MSHEHVVSLDDVEPSRQKKGTRYEFERRSLGTHAGGEGLGCSHMVLPPGKSPWPKHWHAANEEAYFILRGTGTLELGGSEVTLRAGDYVALPPGPSSSHRLTNTGEESLEYLALSTMISTDVGVYPDSGKIGVFAGSAPGGPSEERTVSGFFRLDQEVDYWEGEDVE